MPAEMTVAAGHMVVQRDPVADFEILQPGSDTNDGSRCFVSEDSRRRNGAMMNFLDVGGADSARGDLDEEFARAGAGHGNRFNAKLIDAAINHGPHCLWDFDHAGFLTRSKGG